MGDAGDDDSATLPDGGGSDVQPGVDVTGFDITGLDITGFDVITPTDTPVGKDRVTPTEDRVTPTEDRVTPPVDTPVTAMCGDGMCNGTESCSSCPSDCGTCPARCGDGTCNGTETCTSCASDCGACPPSCGNGTCDSGESCSTCPRDCGMCAPRCGDGMCNGTETCTSCSADCGACAPRCGDGMCNGTETCTSCASDCGACAPRCGDGMCNGTETCTSCAGDCGACTSPVTMSCGTADNTALSRDCGWTRAGSYTCTPGASVLVACSSGSTATDAGAACGTRLGSCTGDTLLRVCAGDTACTASASVTSNDDYCGLCSGATFTCPSTGRYTVLVGPYHSTAAAGTWACNVSTR